MKKIIIAVAFLCSHLVAFAGEKNSFLSFTFGSSFLPTDSYKYSGINGGFTYGYRINSQSFGVIGLDASSQFEGGMRFGYEYDFTVNKGWTPGMNVALLVGVANTNTVYDVISFKKEDETPSPTLGLGADVGLFLKIGSGKWHGLAQTGVKYFSAVNKLGESFGDKFEHYISVALRWSF